MITKIWLGKGMRNINPEAPVNSFRAVHSFSSYNNLRTLVKAQGGYYVVDKDSRLQFVCNTLGSISFKDLYYALKK